MKQKSFQRQYLTERYAQRKHWFDSIKIASGCKDCGIDGPAEILTFDHVSGDKQFNIGPSWNQSKKKLEEEISKCEIVCANCHALRTAQRNSGLPEFIEFPKIPRYSRDSIITEKIDGTNGIVWVDLEGDVWAGSRTRWITPDDDNHGFAKWVEEHKQEFADHGPEIYRGEWWGQGIQRGYGLKEKRFSLFNVIRWDEGMFGTFKHEPWTLNEQQKNRGSEPVFIPPPTCCHVVPVIMTCPEPSTGFIQDALEMLIDHGSFAAPGFMKPEGVILYHVAGGILFKKTIEKDEEGKGS